MLFKGDRGIKGEAGYIQKVNFNATHIVMMGPPGLPGPKVNEDLKVMFVYIYLSFRDESVFLVNQDSMEKKAIEEILVRW